MVDYWVLDNGVRLVTEEIPYLRSVAIGIYVGVGSRDETDNLNGLAHFIEHMLFKGTATRTAKDIAEAFENIGGQLNAYTSKEYTCYYARTLDENFEEALDILFDMVFNSVFSEETLLTEKGVISEEISMYEDSPDELIHDVFSQLLWGNHALGRPILGTKETVMGLERNQVIDYYHRYYVPSNMVIAVAGNIKNVFVRDRISEWLTRTPGSHVSRTKEPPGVPSGNELKLVVKDTEQVQICVGAPSISYCHEDRHVQNIMNGILGGGIGSRLFQTIREQKGLAYSVYTYPTSYSDSGSFCVYAAASPEKVPDLMAALGEEMERFRTSGVTQEEVNRAKRQVKANMYLGMESVMNRMSRLGKSVLFYDRVIPLEEVIDKVMVITPEDVQRFAGEVLRPDRLCLAAIGSKEVLPLVEKGFSLVTR